MNSYLDAVYQTGAHRLAPEKLCSDNRIGQSRVTAVLVYLAYHANDRTGQVWHGVTTIADALAIDRRDVQRALRVLTTAAVIVRVGTHERAAVYEFDPTSWPVDNPPTMGGTPRPDRRDIPPRRAGRSAGEGRDEGRGNVRGDPALTEQNKNRTTTPLPPTPAAPAAPAVHNPTTGVQAQPPDDPPHKHEPNARAAIRNPGNPTHWLLHHTTENQLIALAYQAGHGDPWTGYQAVRARCEEGLGENVRDPIAVIRHRLGLGGTTPGPPRPQLDDPIPLAVCIADTPAIHRPSEA